MTTPTWEKELQEIGAIIKDWILKCRESDEPYFHIPHKKFSDLLDKVASTQRQEILREVSEYIAEYTVDFCENSQQFKADILTKLQSLTQEQDKGNGRT